MPRSRAARRERRLDLLDRRVEFLLRRLAESERTGLSYDKAELGALVWAIGVLEAAIDLGLIGKLEQASDYLPPEIRPDTSVQ